MSGARWRLTWLVVITATCTAGILATPGTVSGHGAASENYRTVIESIEPDGLPIDVSVAKGDQMRLQNQGDAELVLCGYEADCDPYVRIGPEGVFENRNSFAYYANLEANQYGEVPKGVGKGDPKWKLVRREPAFYNYHDHRSHWMEPNRLPPGIDDSDPDVQKINDFEIAFRYDGRDGVVKGRLEYVGGQTFVMRYGELGITGAAIGAMLVVFVIDARRRKRRRVGAAQAAADGS